MGWGDAEPRVGWDSGSRKENGREPTGILSGAHNHNRLKSRERILFWKKKFHINNF